MTEPRESSASIRNEAEKGRYPEFRQRAPGDEVSYLQLPTVGHGAQAGDSYRYPWAIAESSTKRLAVFCTTRGLTLPTLLLGAYQILLHRYTGADEIGVGIDIDQPMEALSGRSESSSRVALLVADCVGNPAALVFLQQIGSGLQRMNGHKDLLYAAPPSHDNSPGRRNPQAVMSYHEGQRVMGLAPASSNHFPQTAASAGLAVDPFDMAIGEPAPDLKLSIVHEQGKLLCSLQSNAGVMSAELLSSMARHYEMVLAAILEDCGTSIGELQILGTEDYETLDAWTQTHVDYSPQCTVSDMLAQQAQRTPDATALVFRDQSLSYRQLDERSNQLAHYLRAQGATTDTLIGICIERSIEMVVGLFGILKAGAAYVPIDRELPAERIEAIITETRIPLLLRDTKSALPEQIKVPQLRVDEDWESCVASQAILPLESEISLNDLAYVIFTSGSTGRPKGILFRHEGLSSHIHWMRKRYPLNASDNVLQKSPCTFDVSTWEIFWTLADGAKVVIAEPEGHRDVFYVKQITEQERITVLNFVPSMLQLFVDTPTTHDLTSLRLTLCSGEIFRPALVDQFLDLCPSCEIHDLYGPSEAEVVSACQRTRNQWSGIINIGWPTPNSRLYVLDRHRQRVPIGVVGELYIGSSRLARGYLNRPDLTAECFINDPFGFDAQERLFKSGDLVRRLPDGSLAFIGRADDQIKLHGLRIELGEIDAVLSQHPDVQQCAVVAREGVNGSKRLVAYIVPTRVADASNPLSDDCVVAERANSCTMSSSCQTDPKWYRYLINKLPEPIVPTTYVIMQALPVTFSGKLDVKALPPPSTQRPSLAASLVLPSMETERIIAGIWQELLQLEVVGIDDGFFELGGHSALALHVQARVAKHFGVKLPAVALLQGGTIRKLAQIIDGMRLGTDELQSGHANIDASARTRKLEMLARKKSRAS
jgi:amino acid adenylation domain-containing protein